MRDVHLRAEVWSNATTRQVVVAFGGTAGSSLDDWKANLRWVLAFFDHKDEYTVLTDIFVPAFSHEYQGRSFAWRTQSTLPQSQSSRSASWLSLRYNYLLPIQYLRFFRVKLGLRDNAAVKQLLQIYEFLVLRIIAECRGRFHIWPTVEHNLDSGKVA